MRYAWIAAWLGLACAAGVPGAPAPGTSQAFGHVRLVPREGVTPGGQGGGSYSDRRLRDVEFVDYTRPGFAVAYAEAASPPGGELVFAIQDWRVSTRIEPENGAVGARGRDIQETRDSATSLSLGVGSLFADAAWKTVAAGLYVGVHERTPFALGDGPLVFVAAPVVGFTE